jgi:hypothetical protein
MKFFLVCLVVAVVSIGNGCVHSRVLTNETPPDTLAQLNQDFGGRPGTIKLHTGEYIPCQLVHLTADSILYTNHSGTQEAFPNSDIERVVIRDHSRGLLDGAEYGAGIGAFVGTGLGFFASILSESSANCSDCNHDKDVLTLPEGLLFGALGGAFLGAGFGAVLGGTEGSIMEVRYSFPADKTIR